MFGDQSIVYTWSQSWNLWDDAAIIPVYSQMRGWANIVDGVFAGIDEFLGTVDKTKRMGYENLNRTPGATICRGLAQMLWIPVILRATYKTGSFVYYSIMSPSVKSSSLNRSLVKSPSLGFTVYKHVESQNAHYLAGKKLLENKEYQLAVDEFVHGIGAGDIDSGYMRAWIWLKEMNYKETESKDDMEIHLKIISKKDIRSEFLYHETDTFISDWTTRRNVFLKVAKQGYLPAIRKLANFLEGVMPLLEEYVQKGSIALEKEDPKTAAQFYVSLATVFDEIGNPTAQKRLLEKAAALCTIDTIVTIASCYRVTNPLAYDPFLATIDSYDNGDEASAKRFRAIGYEFHWNNNLDLAEKYHLKAANLGNASSMVCLADVLSEKEGLNEMEKKQNNAEILSWLQKAADLKNSQAYNRLGHASRYGLYGLEKNIYSAISYYSEGADENNEYGTGIVANMRELAEIYEKGADGIPIDLNKALEWYRKENTFRIKAKIVDHELPEKIKELETEIGI